MPRVSSLSPETRAMLNTQVVAQDYSKHMIQFGPDKLRSSGIISSLHRLASLENLSSDSPRGLIIPKRSVKHTEVVLKARKGHAKESDPQMTSPNRFSKISASL